MSKTLEKQYESYAIYKAKQVEEKARRCRELMEDGEFGAMSVYPEEISRHNLELMNLLGMLSGMRSERRDHES